MGEQPAAQKSKPLSLIPLPADGVPHSFPEVILFANSMGLRLVTWSLWMLKSSVGDWWRVSS